MASSELEDFVRKNKPKKQEQAKPDKSAPQSAPHKAQDFLTVYKLLSGQHLTIAFGIAMAIILFFGFKLLTRLYNNELEKAIILLGLIAFVAADLFLLYFVLHYLPYKKFLSSNVPITGWRELVHNRSTDFWKGHTYLSVSLKIELSAAATHVHRQALDIFLNQMVNRWGRKHAGKWIGSSPNEMRLNGTTLEGHVAVHTGTTFLIRALAFHLPVIANMLGDGLKNISFAAKGERSFEAEVEEDTQADERHRRMMERD